MSKKKIFLQFLDSLDYLNCGSQSASYLLIFRVSLRAAAHGLYKPTSKLYGRLVVRSRLLQPVKGHFKHLPSSYAKVIAHQHTHVVKPL